MIKFRIFKNRKRLKKLIYLQNKIIQKKITKLIKQIIRIHLLNKNKNMNQ